MIRNAGKLDAKAVEAIGLAVAACGLAPEAAAALADDLGTRLLPTFGPSAIRRRVESDMMASYKEGFSTGQAAGRYARWHALVWRASQTFRRLRAPAEGADAARYERYNY